MKTKALKLLPWLAKKAGIPERRAALLWREAENWATRRVPVDSPAHHELAINRLLELIDAEALREDAASFGWRPWARMQTRFWGWVLQTAQASSVLASKNWQRLASIQTPHPG